MEKPKILSWLEATANNTPPKMWMGSGRENFCTQLNSSAKANIAKKQTSQTLMFLSLGLSQFYYGGMGGYLVGLVFYQLQHWH